MKKFQVEFSAPDSSAKTKIVKLMAVPYPNLPLILEVPSCP